jgi:hypothetical protein
MDVTFQLLSYSLITYLEPEFRYIVGNYLGFEARRRWREKDGKGKDGLWERV